MHCRLPASQTTESVKDDRNEKEDHRHNMQIRARPDGARWAGTALLCRCRSGKLIALAAPARYGFTADGSGPERHIAEPVHEELVVCGTGDHDAADTCIGQHATDRRGQAGLQCRADPHVMRGRTATTAPLLRIASRTAVETWHPGTSRRLPICRRLTGDCP